MINNNIKKIKPSATLAINLQVKDLRNQNKDIIHFGFGQSPFPIHKSIVKTLKKNATNNHYLPTLGLEKLRNQIALFLNEHQNIIANKELVFIGPGSKELLFQTILLFKGTFLIPKGSWVSYGPQIESVGGKYAILNTSFNNDFKLTSKTLENYCNQNNESKILILNSPNNPTGAVYSVKELKEISIVCKKHNIIVMSDEIYSQLNFNDLFSPSIATFYPEKTIVFGGLSKVFSAGGYRLGFMSLPDGLKELKDVYKSLFSETFSAVSSPIQFAGVKAFKMSAKLQKYIKKQTEILLAVSNYIYKELSAINIECTKSQGAFYLMIGFEKYKSKLKKLDINTSEELSNYLLVKYNIALLPASDFYFDKEELYFRLAFVDFNGKKVLKAYKNEKVITNEFIKNHCENIYKGVETIKKFTEFL